MMLKPISFMRKASEGGGGSSGNFTYTLVDSKSRTNPAADPSFTATEILVAGDLLVMIVAERSGEGSTNMEVVDANGKTWNYFENYDNEIADGNGRLSAAAIWREVEATGETDTTPLITAHIDSTDPGGSAGGYLFLHFRPSAAYDWTESASAANGSGLSDWSGTSSGSASATGDDIFELAVGVCRQGTDEPTTGNISFSTQTDQTAEATDSDNRLTFYAAIEGTSQASGSKSATITSNGSGNEGIVFILCWSDGA